MANSLPQRDVANQGQIEQAEKSAQKSSTSKGESLFNAITYGGSGIAVFTAAAHMGWWAKYGGGKDKFAHTVARMGSKGIPSNIANELLMNTALMQPGNLAVIPIKAMEDHKLQIVEKLNTMLGDKSGDASVDNDSEQSWGSLIKSRIAAFVAVGVGLRTGAVMLGGNFDKFENAFSEKLVGGILRQPTHMPGMAKIVENETKAFQLGKVAAIDSFATVAAMGILYASSKLFAGNNPKWKARDLPTPPTGELSANEPALQMAEYNVASPTARLFTDAVVAQGNSVLSKTRSGSFAEAVNAQKNADPSTQRGI